MKRSESLRERRIDARNRLQSGVFTGLVFLVLFGLVRACQVWEAPIPPPPRQGMIMDFGNLMEGASTPKEVQPTEEIIESEPEQIQPDNSEVVTAENDLPELEETTEPVEEVPQEVIEEVESTSPEVPSNEPIEEEEPGDTGQPDATQASDQKEAEENGEEGTSLDLVGWKWDAPPQPRDNSNELGTLVFRIVIDDRGEVLAATTESRLGISYDVAELYRKEILSLTFSPTRVGDPPLRTQGKITIKLKKQ
ncbi:MAG: hypothetical protein AAF740_04135 [Bacteroidota bacterium]